MLMPVVDGDEEGVATVQSRPSGTRLWRLLLRDPVATAALIVLIIMAVTAIVGPIFLGGLANNQDLEKVDLPPFDPHNGWQFFLGSDQLGRSVLVRLIVASQTTLLVAVPTVLISSIIGSALGLWAGFHRGRREAVLMRTADVILSFPSLMLAVVVLALWEPSARNIVLVLSIARMPIYMRTARAEAAELRSRLFVDAARTFGTKNMALIFRHILPIVLPTLLTIATLDFCHVMLAESSLSFLGIGIQPPDISWGLLVAQGRTYLDSAWWLALLPGFAIVITTLSATMLASWMRVATDPSQRWRLLLPGLSRRRLSTRLVK
jgi:peptide/nickel transport system permease protein